MYYIDGTPQNMSKIGVTGVIVNTLISYARIWGCMHLSIASFPGPRFIRLHKGKAILCLINAKVL